MTGTRLAHFTGWCGVAGRRHMQAGTGHGKSPPAQPALGFSLQLPYAQRCRHLPMHVTQPSSGPLATLCRTLYQWTHNTHLPDPQNGWHQVSPKYASGMMTDNKSACGCQPHSHTIWQEGIQGEAAVGGRSTQEISVLPLNFAVSPKSALKNEEKFNSWRALGGEQREGAAGRRQRWAGSPVGDGRAPDPSVL